MDWMQSELSLALVSDYLLLSADQWHVAANSEWQLLMEGGEGERASQKTVK